MSNDPTTPSTEALGSAVVVERGLPQYVKDLIQVVRAKLRDYPELNRLIAGHESSDQQIALAMLETVDDWNMSPPLLGAVTLRGFPSRSPLVTGTLVKLLESVALLQTRNNMTYSDGQGIQVSVSDKAPMLMQWVNLFSNQFERKKTQLKTALNLQGALNGRGIESEYSAIDGLYDGEF